MNKIFSNFQIRQSKAKNILLVLVFVMSVTSTGLSSANTGAVSSGQPVGGFVSGGPSSTPTSGASTVGVPSTDITSSGFKLIVCDGPVRPDGKYPYQPYVPCDFDGVMRQIQHLINIMIVLGVLASIAMFTYAGFLYIQGTQGGIKTAKEIFRNVAIGFIIMLSAWFIVYQILDWLTGNSGFGVLLGGLKK